MRSKTSTVSRSLWSIQASRLPSAESVVQISFPVCETPEWSRGSENVTGCGAEPASWSICFAASILFLTRADKVSDSSHLGGLAGAHASDVVTSVAFGNKDEPNVGINQIKSNATSGPSDPPDGFLHQFGGFLWFVERLFSYRTFDVKSRRNRPWRRGKLMFKLAGNSRRFPLLHLKRFNFPQSSERGGDGEGGLMVWQNNFLRRNVANWRVPVIWSVQRGRGHAAFQSETRSIIRNVFQWSGNWDRVWMAESEWRIPNKPLRHGDGLELLWPMESTDRTLVFPHASWRECMSWTSRSPPHLG